MRRRVLWNPCQLVRVFSKVMQLMLCKDAASKELADFAKPAMFFRLGGAFSLPAISAARVICTRSLWTAGASGLLLGPRDHIGMLENSGAERRHEVGRVKFKKSLSSEGTGKATKGTKTCENRSAYLGKTLGVGRYMLAQVAAQQRAEKQQAGRQACDR